jgi:hypothetical protein
MFDRQGNTGNNQSNSDWKADAFLNLFLPRKDGSRMKLGFCALKMSQQDQAQLINWVKEDPEGHLEILKQKLVIEFKELAQASAGLDL